MASIAHPVAKTPDDINYGHLKGDDPGRHAKLSALDARIEKAGGLPKTPGVFTERAIGLMEAAQSLDHPNVRRDLGAVVRSPHETAMARVLSVRSEAIWAQRVKSQIRDHGSQLSNRQIDNWIESVFGRRPNGTNSKGAKVEWKQPELGKTTRQVRYAAAYDAAKDKVDWRLPGTGDYAHNSKPMTIVFDPVRGSMQTRQPAPDDGNPNPWTGVFNPKSGTVEWRRAEASKNPWAAIYNPVSQEVEWKRTAPVGFDHVECASPAFDPTKGEVVWFGELEGFVQNPNPWTGIFDPDFGKIDWRQPEFGCMSNPVAFTAVLVPGRRE